MGAVPQASVSGICIQNAATAGARVFLVAERPGPRDSTFSLTLCLTGHSERAATKVGGYYGEITFARDVKVIRVDGPGTGMRVENSTRPGRVSFAGASNEGFPSGPILTVVFGSQSHGTIPRTALRMMEITDVSGRSISKAVHVDTVPVIRPAAR